MTDVLILRDLGVIILAAAVALLLVRSALPSIATYIVVGLVLGPLTGLVLMNETLDLISEAGIALLLFLVGLELSLDKIRDVGKVAVYAGLGQIGFTAAGGFALSWLLGFGTFESIFIATALTFSSTVVVVKLLDQKKEIDQLYGRIAVGIFLVQDIVVILVLTVLAGLGRRDTMELETIVRDLGLAFGGMVILLAAAAVAARYILPRIFGWVSHRPEALFVWSLSWCFLFVFGAETLHLSIEIGAFLAGISLAQLPYNQELRRRVHPLMNFFIAIFFVSLGLQMELGAARALLGPAIVLSLFVLVGKIVIFMWIISRLKFRERTSFLASVTVAQISEFSFIVAAMGLAVGLIDEPILSLIGVVGLITIGVSSYMIQYNHQLYELVQRTGVLRIFGAEEEAAEPPDSLRDHVIVVGMNSLGRALVRRLTKAGERTLAIDTDPRKLAGVEGEVLLGNVEYLSVLEQAGIARARLLVSALQIEDTNNLLAYRAREAGTPSSIHALDPVNVRELEELGATHVMVSTDEGVERILETLHGEGIFGR